LFRPKPTSGARLDFFEYLAARIVLRVMNTAHPPVGIAYASGYARGRHAAKEHIPVAENPYGRGTSAYQGWNDGHYDEQSARYVAVERHRALLWSHDGTS
jgi:hypothetical protein